MKTFQDVVEMVGKSRSATGSELYLAFAAGEIAPVGPRPGSERAKSLYATFALREKTSAAAGLSKSGFESTLRALRRLAPDERVLLYHFSGSEKVFTVFIREAGARVIGCIRVDRDRSREDPTVR